MFRVTFEGMLKEGDFFGMSWAILVLLSGAVRLWMPLNRDPIDAEHMCLALASVCIFFYMVGFYTVSDQLGPFMVLLKTMIMNDLSKWLSITLLFVLGYAQAMLMITYDLRTSFFGTYKWLLGDSTTDLDSSDALRGLLVFLFISYSILVSISLVNILTAMFGSTYDKVMSQSHSTWLLQYSRLLLLLERVLFFLPSWVLRLIGFRVLHPRNSNQRKVILRLVYRDGYRRYEWIDTRCGIRYALSKQHEASVRAFDKDDSGSTSLALKPSPWLAFWTAEVDERTRALFQPTNDDDEVFLLQLEKNASLKDLYGSGITDSKDASED